MRIAFIHSCLEPGKDGVGDYTRLLAEECLRQGHPACTVALNDRFVSGGPVEIAGVVPCLRLGAHEPWPERIQKARAFLDSFRPDRVSLQFVCYGYDPKGIARGIGKRFQALLGNTPVYLMFHELWIGEESGAPLKDRIVGTLQRYFILQMIRALQPKFIHTSNPTYLQRLGQRQVTAKQLPLFGLIPISEQPDNTWIQQEFEALGLDVTGSKREELWIFGMFGTLHSVWPPEPLFSYLIEAGRQQGKRIVVAAIGRMGAGEALWNSLGEQYSETITFCKVGERPTEQVSAFLQFVDFGIATTPWAIIGKSATVSTMLDHGVPVIVNRDELSYGFPTSASHSSPLLFKLTPSLISMLPDLKRQPPQSTLPAIAGDFLRDLQG